MAISLSGRLPEPLLITPDCHSPDCGVTGDQYTMVQCRACGGWFGPAHIDAAAGARLVRLGRWELRDLAYYEGICVPCHQAHEPIH